MITGLPGAGIGGVFYLILALLMPFTELYKTIRGESSRERWMIVVRHLIIAASIFAGMWCMGLFLGVILEAWSHPDSENINQMVQMGQIHELAKLNIFHIAPVIISLATLSFILMMTRLLVLVFRPARTQ